MAYKVSLQSWLA